VGGFNILDWVVLAILLWSIVTSVMRGFVREVLGLATIVAGLLVASWFHGRIAPLVEALVRTENQALLVSFAGLFLLTLLAGFGAIRLIRKFVKFARVEWVDRLLGGAFGFVRGWLVAAVIFLALTSFGVLSGTVGSSRLSPFFLPAVRVVAAFTPFDLRARFLVGYEHIRRLWDEARVAVQDEVFGEESESAPSSEDASDPE
jgi:membrane protein required for colicin V production